MAFYNSIPLFGKYLKSESRTSKYTAKQLSSLEKDYRDTIGLGDNATFSSDAFDKLVNSRISDFHGFSKTKAPGDVSIHDKLTVDSPEAKIVREGLNKSLEKSKQFDEAQKTFTDSTSTFQKLVNLIPQKFRAEDLIGTMKEYVDEGRNKILAQQQHEIKALEEQFDTAKNPDFVPNLKKALSLTSDPDVETVKKNLLTDLKESHKKQLEEFDKSTSESLDKLHKASASQATELLFVANLYENAKKNKNKEMLMELEGLIAAQREKMGLPPETTTVQVGISPDKITLSGVKIDTIKKITSDTGREIHQQKDGSFVMQLPMINPRYYQDPRQNVQADMMLIAQAIKAKGYDSIEMNCNFPNSEDVAMERGRQAFRACIEAGYPPEKITINVNGTKMDAQKLFEHDKKTYQDIMSKAPEIQKTYEELASPKTSTTPLNTVAVKEEITALKEKQKQLEQQTETEHEDTHGLSNTTPH